MGFMRKTLSLTFAGGLIGYRSKAEKAQRDVRRAATAAEQQNELIAEQNGLIQDQTAAIIQQQQTLIEQQAEALRLQDEQLRTQHGGNAAPAPLSAQAQLVEKARQAANRSHGEFMR